MACDSTPSPSPRAPGDDVPDEVGATEPTTESTPETSTDPASEGRIAKDDPVASEIRQRTLRKIEHDEIEIPRMPEVAAKILDFTKSSDASAKDILRHVRTDPALAGKLLERANSAAFAGSQPVYSLQMAVVRLGLNQVCEIAFELSGGVRKFSREKRSNLLTRRWKFSMATGFACEELAKQVAGENPESGFLTGLFHGVATPAIVDVVEEMEREKAVPEQGEIRLQGLLARLTTELSVRIVRSWGTPKPAVEAIELQDSKVRDRRRKPHAHLLVCAKTVATELGMGVRPRPIDFNANRDFHFLKLDEDSKVEPAREAVMDKMLQVAKV